MTALDMSRVYRLDPGESLRPSGPNGSGSRLLVGGDQSDGRYTFRWYRAEGNMYPHTHDKEDENVYVLSGNPTIRLGDKDHRLNPGSFLFMPRRVMHAIYSDEPWEGLSVSSPGHIFDALMDEIAELIASDNASPERMGAVLKRAGITVHEGKWYGETPILQ